jgi:hypothetical protein
MGPLSYLDKIYYQYRSSSALLNSSHVKKLRDEREGLNHRIGTAARSRCA